MNKVVVTLLRLAVFYVAFGHLVMLITKGLKEDAWPLK